MRRSTTKNDQNLWSTKELVEHTQSLAFHAPSRALCHKIGGSSSSKGSRFAQLSREAGYAPPVALACAHSWAVAQPDAPAEPSGCVMAKPAGKVRLCQDRPSILSSHVCCFKNYFFAGDIPNSFLFHKSVVITRFLHLWQENQISNPPRFTLERAWCSAVRSASWGTWDRPPLRALASGASSLERCFSSDS